MTLNRSSVIKLFKALLLPFVLAGLLMGILQLPAAATGFKYPKINPDPNPLQILGPAGERFIFVKTGETTNGRYVMADAVVPPGGGPLPHIHHYTDEWFYFPDGGLTLEMGNNLYPDLEKVPGIKLPKERLHLVKTQPGDLFYGPRYHVHGFTNPGTEPKRLVFVWTPDTEKTGVTNYFREVGQPLPDPENPPPIDPKSKALFVSQAPKYGINQSSDFYQYVDQVDYNFPQMDNKVDELLALLAPETVEGQAKTADKPTSFNRVIAGKFTVKPEKREEMIRMAQTLYAPSRAEAGSVSYNFYQDSADQNTFLFFEEWKDQAAINYHFQTSYFKQFADKFSELIVGTPSIKVYDVTGVKQMS